MENLERQPVRRGMRRKSMVMGLLVLGLGAIWLMYNFGMISPIVWDYIISWQMLLIAIGLINVAADGHRGFGWILIAVGGFFLLNDMFDWPVTFRHVFWPALLIAIGMVLIFGSQWKFRKRYHYTKSEGEEVIEEISIFGGRERIVHADQFRGGEIISVFGGSKLDLTHATLAEGGATIEIVSVFGGSTLLVPNDWNVKLEVFNIFGGYSDKRMRGPVDTNKVLVIKGVAIFGGGELKSF